MNPDSGDQQDKNLQPQIPDANNDGYNIQIVEPVGSAESDDEENWEEEEDNKGEAAKGCSHYQRNCEVEAPCCKIFYSCKLCHDEQYEGPKSNKCKVERMEFDKVSSIKCLNCELIQQPSLNCSNSKCEIKFGEYACLKCKLYQNNPAKVNDIFHCDECKMCRRGKKQNFFHCGVCGYCRHISQKNNHKCAQNIAEAYCPICLQVLKYSTKFYQSLNCGHLIHLQCLSSYTNINCPVCGMAIQKISKTENEYIEAMISQTKDNLPPQLKDKKVNVICNECLHKTMDAQFHYFGVKCSACGTFNTKMI